MAASTPAMSVRVSNNQLCSLQHGKLTPLVASWVTRLRERVADMKPDRDEKPTRWVLTTEKIVLLLDDGAYKFIKG